MTFHSQDRKNLASIGLIIVGFIVAVFVLALCYGIEDDHCQTNCTEQFGPDWKARVTRTEYSSICDCVGPKGDLKVPQ